jgi:Transcriptional regulator containing an amidase domain and an AraC-type DNA-binding HTH domain
MLYISIIISVRCINLAFSSIKNVFLSKVQTVWGDLSDMINMKKSDFMDMDYSIHYQFITRNTLMKTTHSHDFWEIFFVIIGSVKHNINGTSDILENGSVILIHPGDIHMFEAPDDNGEYLNFAVSDELVSEICNFLTLNKLDLYEIKKPLRMGIGQADIIYAVERLRSLHSINESIVGKARELKTIATELILSITRMYISENDSTGTPLWLKQIINEMSKPENIELGITEVSKKHGYNTRLLNKTLDRCFGVKSGEYTARLRIGYAANLLTNTDMDVLSISLRVGYGSLSYFIKLFKKYYSLSPLQYRKHMTGIN